MYHNDTVLLEESIQNIPYQEQEKESKFSLSKTVDTMHSKVQIRFWISDIFVRSEYTVEQNEVLFNRIFVAEYKALFRLTITSIDENHNTGEFDKEMCEYI